MRIAGALGLGLASLLAALGAACGGDEGTHGAFSGSGTASAGGASSSASSAAAGSGPAAGGQGGAGAVGSSTSSVGSTGAGGLPQECEACGKQSCLAPLTNCAGSAECATWVTCIQGCGGQEACQAGCDMQHIAAEADYLAVYQCLCASCNEACAVLGACTKQPCVDEALPLLSAPPATLAETGLFQGMDPAQVAAYVQHFTPQFILWSDGAAKERWAYIPKCSQIDASNMDHWQMPVGSRFWKQFTRDGVRVETRFIHRYGPGQDDWIFAAYQWDPQLTSAVHVPAGVPNANETQHDIPSEQQCKNCHTKLAERILGVSAIQMSFTPNAGDMSIAGLSAAGKLTVPAPAGFAAPGDNLARPALGYLHANCGNCHNDTGVAAVNMHLRLLVDDATVQDTDVWQTAVGKTATLFQCGGCERIEPGFPDQSAIIQRMSVRGTPAQMPPLGTEIVDPAGIGMVSTWIASLAACSAAGETCNGTIDCCGGSCVNQTCVDACVTAGASCTSNGACCTGVCGMNGACACSGDFQPCATDADCCLNVACDTANGICL